MKAVFVIDIDDEDELGEAFATITSEEKDYYFFAKGVIRPLPHKLQADWYTDGYKEGFNACLDAITGETE